MDLRQAYKVTLDALAREEQDIARRKQELLDKEASLNRIQKRTGRSE